MCQFRIVLSLSICCGLIASSYGSVLFYGGDPTDSPAQSDLFFIAGPGEAGVIAFDDFTVTAPTWNVTKVRLKLLSSASFNPQFGQIEIRSSIGPGHAGSLVFEDQVAGVTSVVTGRTIASLPEYEISAELPNVQLDQGTYWLGFRPISDGGVVPSSGANAVGTPILNNNSFARSTFAMYNYRPISEITGRNPYDLSYTIEGTAVPEPVSLVALLGAGIACVMQRRSRRK